METGVVLAVIGIIFTRFYGQGSSPKVPRRFHDEPAWCINPKELVNAVIASE